jgi:3-mercaptopyruvate sulfurtransferase SseA
VTSATTILALHLLGCKGLSVYDGSMTEFLNAPEAVPHIV